MEPRGGAAGNNLGQWLCSEWRRATPSPHSLPPSVCVNQSRVDQVGQAFSWEYLRSINPFTCADLELTRSPFSLSSVLPPCLFSHKTPVSKLFSLFPSLPFSYLCFESSSSRSSSSKKNKVIKLVDITDIQKVTTLKHGQFESGPGKLIIDHIGITDLYLIQHEYYCMIKCYWIILITTVLLFSPPPVQSTVSPTRKWDGHLYSHSFHSEGTVWRHQSVFFPF